MQIGQRACDRQRELRSGSKPRMWWDGPLDLDVSTAGERVVRQKPARKLHRAAGVRPLGFDVIRERHGNARADLGCRCTDATEAPP